MSPTMSADPVAAKVKQIRAAEKRKAREARRAKDAAVFAEATRAVAKDAEIAKQAAHKRAADAVEASMASMAPSITVAYAGHAFTFDLGAREGTVRLTAVEGAKRCALKLANEFRDRVARSRIKEAVEPPSVNVGPMLESDGELRHAMKAGVLSVRSDL